MEALNLAFVADVHLGKLARTLRLLGFDILYNNTLSAEALRRIASEQKRVLLSRSAAIATYGSIAFCIIQSEKVEEQVHQVLRQFHLKAGLAPFSRCLVCNGLLKVVPKENIAEKLPQQTNKFFNQFWQCGDCKRIYWKGSHYDRMLALVKRIEQATVSGNGFF